MASGDSPAGTSRSSTAPATLPKPGPVQARSLPDEDEDEDEDEDGEPIPAVPSTPPAVQLPDPAFRFAYGGAKPLAWPAQYRRFGIVDGVLTASGAAAALTAALLGPNPSGPSGGIWFDDDVREALRPSSYRPRLLAADLSDVFIGFAISYGLMIDPVVNAGWLHKNRDVGRQLFALNLEVLAVTFGVQQVFANAIGRERPYGQVCGTDDLDARTFDCIGDDRFRSHFSGHSAVSFSMAAATCTHHSFLPLSGSSPLGVCLLGFSNALATAMLRVVADKHYITDVMVGSAVGSLVGWAIPFLHYKTGRKSSLTALGDLELTIVPGLGGATIFGVMP